MRVCLSHAPLPPFADVTCALRYLHSRTPHVAHGDLKGASTQQLLADMYANASDEERASLLAAAAAGADKRRGRAGA